MSSKKAKLKVIPGKGRHSPKGPYSSIDIIIPVFNEGGNIEKTLREIREKIRVPFNILIVYDFEEDNTLPVVNKLLDRYPMTLVRNKYGRGVLNAIKTGFETARGGAVLVMMADLSDDLAAVDRMFDKLNEGHDIVCGSRYMKGGAQIGGPLLKKTLSRTAGLSLHMLTGIPTHDITNSFKMYSRKVLDSIKIESTGGFELGMEIVVKAYLSGFRIAEVPSVWSDRVAGESKFMLRKWLPRYIHWYLYALRHKKIKKAATRAIG